MGLILGEGIKRELSKPRLQVFNCSLKDTTSAEAMEGIGCLCRSHNHCSNNNSTENEKIMIIIVIIAVVIPKITPKKNQKKNTILDNMNMGGLMHVNM